MPRLASDLVPALLAACEGDVTGIALQFDAHRAALTVVMAAAGYPGAVMRGSTIRGIAEAGANNAVIVFQAGTRAENGRIVADGGRVLAVTATGDSMMEAQARAYAAVSRIDWPEGLLPPGHRPAGCGPRSGGGRHLTKPRP